MTQYLIIKTSLKSQLRDKEMNMGEGFYEELNSLINQKIAKAIKRASANNRKTVYSKDV